MKYSLIAVAVILLGFAGMVGYSYFQSSNQMNTDSMMQPQSMKPSDEKMVANDMMTVDEKKATDSEKIIAEDKMMEGKKYLPYSESVFETAASGKRVLFFYADWCPTCRPTDADLQANMSKIPEGVTVLRVNYNDTATDQAEKDLAKKYGVTYQHTFVQIDAEGNEVTKWNGGKTTELLAKIK